MQRGSRVGILVALLGTLMASGARAGDQGMDRASIQKMAGCFEVTFEFSETFARQPGYVPHAPYKTGGVEWVVVDGASDGEIALQHILLTPMGPLKHWRQEWVYEPTAMLAFAGDNQWVKHQVAPASARGQWAQRVLQVDDSPRYECTAPWVHWNDTHYWECAAWAPLPRRESARTDYNVLARRNRQALHGADWWHEEDNDKLLVAGQALTLITKEKGQNTYRRVDDARCSDAATFWEANKTYWHDIQAVWREVYAGADVLRFAPSRDGAPLWQKLFELAEDASAREPYDGSAMKREARRLIDSYLIR